MNEDSFGPSDGGEKGFRLKLALRPKTLYHISMEFWSGIWADIISLFGPLVTLLKGFIGILIKLFNYIADFIQGF